MGKYFFLICICVYVFVRVKEKVEEEQEQIVTVVSLEGDWGDRKGMLVYFKHFCFSQLLWALLLRIQMIKTIRMSQTFCNEVTKPKVTKQGNRGVRSLVTQKNSLQQHSSDQRQASRSVNAGAYKLCDLG